MISDCSQVLRCIKSSSILKINGVICCHHRSNIIGLRWGNPYTHARCWMQLAMSACSCSFALHQSAAAHTNFLNNNLHRCWHEEMKMWCCRKELATIANARQVHSTLLMEYTHFLPVVAWNCTMLSSLHLLPKKVSLNHHVATKRYHCSQSVMVCNQLHCPHNKFSPQQVSLYFAVQYLLFVTTVFVIKRTVLILNFPIWDVPLQSKCSDWFPISLSLHQHCPYKECPCIKATVQCTCLHCF